MKTNYSKAKYHSPQKYGEKLAIILLILQMLTMIKNSPLFGAEGCQLALENSVKLLSVCRNYESLPIVFTEVKYKNGGEDGGAFYKRFQPCLVLMKEKNHKKYIQILN